MPFSVVRIITSSSLRRALDLVARPKIAAEEYRSGFGGFRLRNTGSGNILKFPSQTYYDVSFMYKFQQHLQRMPRTNLNDQPVE